MASHQSQEFDFVEELSRDFLCPVSLELLREPHQTLCCGRHISRDSVTLLQTQKQPCPLCRKETLKTLPDQYFKRKIRELKVRCPSKVAGCEWVGELGELDRHLESCSLQEVACEFSHLGCEVRLQQEKMAEHVDQSVKTHLLMACRTIQKQTDTIEQLRDAAQRQMASQKQMISNLQQQIKQLSLHLKPESLTKLVFLPPPTLVMTNFSQHKRDGDNWYSPPFYSHIGGYKMTLRVRANGQGAAEDSHVSVSFHLMRGEFDDNLSWPFQGKVTFQLVNQKVDHGHMMVNIPFDPQYGSRVTGSERTLTGVGLAKFISHTALSYDSIKNTEFLKENCLEFRILQITLTI